MEPRYVVEISDAGCSACGAGKTYAIVDRVTDTELLGQAFSDEDDAEAIAEALNAAFTAGAAQARAADEEDKELLRAADEIVTVYQAMPDGELGRGLTNGHFYRLRDAVAAVRVVRAR